MPLGPTQERLQVILDTIVEGWWEWDLRSPVATVLGLLQVIKEQINSKEDILEVIILLERTVTKMDAVIRDISLDILSQTKK